MKGNASGLQGNIAAGAGSTVAFDQNAPGTYAGVVSGGGNFTKTGSDTLTLSGSNTYTGLTDVQSGTLVTGTNERLADSSTLRISGGTLDISSFTESVGAVTMTSGTIAGTTGKLTGLSYSFINSGVVSAALGGNVPITKSGTGTVVLSGSNTQSGAITINGGALQLGDGGATGSLQSSSAITNNATLAFNRSDTLTQGTNFAATVSGSGGIVQMGAGTTILSGSNSYSGGSTLSSGTLQIGNAHALGSGGLTVNGGTLNLHGTSLSVPTFSGAGGEVTNTVSGTSTLTTTVASGTTSYAGTIVNGTGAVAVNKQGAGTLALSGSLNIASLNADSGITALSQTATIGALTIGSGATLSMAAHTGSTWNVIDTSALTLSGTTGSIGSVNMNAAADLLAWDGQGGDGVLAIMVSDNSQLCLDTFAGVGGLTSEPIDFGQTSPKVTNLGDLNSDGIVDSSDYALLAYGFETQVYGVLNGGGSTTPAQTESSGTGAAPASPEAVPEPGSIGLLLAGAASLLGFRRNRKAGK